MNETVYTVVHVFDEFGPREVDTQFFVGKEKAIEFDMVV